MGQANLDASPLPNGENTGRSVAGLLLKVIIHVERDWEDRSAMCTCSGGGLGRTFPFSTGLQEHLLKRYLNVRGETCFL